jgi:hypothetical protein
MANRLSWAASKTSLVCSTFMSHLAEIILVIRQRLEKYSSYIMVLQLRQERYFAILDIRGRYSTGCCSFRMTFLFSLKIDYEARGNGAQVAQNLIVPDPLR